MKFAKKIYLFVLIFPFCCFGSPSEYLGTKPIVYTIEESLLKPNTLSIHVNLPVKHAATQFLLRGVSMGIAEQVKDVVCDGKPIKENTPGVWSVSSDCQKLQWNVPLLEGADELASAQQSIKSGDFILISEVSSLPRLQNSTTTELLKISVSHLKTIYPVPGSDGEINLPNTHSAPFFILLNGTPAGSISSEKIKLSYWLDNGKSISILPSIDSHMNGLKWLNTIIPGKDKEDLVERLRNNKD